MADSIETEFRLKLPSHFEANTLFKDSSNAIVVGEEIDLCLIAKQLDGSKDIWEKAVSNVRAAVSVVDIQGSRPPKENFDCKVVKSSRGRDKHRRSPPKTLDSPDSQKWQKLNDNTMKLIVPIQFVPDSKTLNKSYKIFVALWSTDGAESNLELSTHKLMSPALNVQFPPLITSRVVQFSGKTFLKIELRNVAIETIQLNSLKVLISAEKEGEITIDHSTLPNFPMKLDKECEYSFIVEIIDCVKESDNRSSSSSNVNLVAELNWENEGASALDRITTTYSLQQIALKYPQLSLFVTLPEILGSQFIIEYTLQNYMQDFRNIKLTLPDYDAEGLIFSKRSIDLGVCSVRSIKKAKVLVTILKPGTFDLCKNVKMSLQYSTPKNSDPNGPIKLDNVLKLPCPIYIEENGNTKN
ncbi:DgyrCDS9010 [Dimorphilus gyrociliatus]|uniref:DgyrCDS9010 n=1 Tax=Dimorphilus gyrociliatus TaxID=2664684 RepID=A0A7I8VVU3_9ANNE|nr:DgyrCDS9010 [Dimorphilus gyrociliatus]